MIIIQYDKNVFLLLMSNVTKGREEAKMWPEQGKRDQIPEGFVSGGGAALSSLNYSINPL